jgi:23S rRNA pseudouridine2605 synthase
LNWRARNIRLQVYLSHAGVASRRAAEEIIAAGRVSVNGVTITAQGSKVEEGDVILLDGKPLALEEKKVYLALNKPAGFICSSSDPQGRPLALSLLGDYKERLYNVGRLDFQSCGLIFFTNDGSFASRLSHPSSLLEKEYVVEGKGPVSDEAIQAFREGVTVEGVHYKAKHIERINFKCIRVVLIEGKNREIRRVFSHFHLSPAVLRRVRIGPVLLGDLPEGRSRPLTADEVKKLGEEVTPPTGSFADKKLLNVPPFGGTRHHAENAENAEVLRKEFRGES